MKHEGRGDAEGHEVGERVQLAPERPARPSAARDGAVDRVQNGGDGDGDRRPAHLAVDREQDREEADAQATAGDHIGRADEPPHVVASAPW